MVERNSVLIVDDLPENLELLFEALRDVELHVLVAESGESAIKRLDKFLPDLILLDVAMPGLNGFETCQRIKGNPDTADVPVIFLTASDETIDKIHGFEVGGVDYITKPIQVEEVLARVNTHITLNRLQREAQAQNEILEIRVKERTTELVEEIEKRKKYEAEKQKLLDIVTRQSDQLSNMTHWLIESQKESNQEQTAALQGELVQNLAKLQAHLQTHQRLFKYWGAEQNGIAPTSLLSEPADDGQNPTVLNHLQDALGLVADMQADLEDPLARPERLTVEEQEILNSPLLNLSAREREVVQLLAAGKSYSEIADLLYLSENTIRSHKARIMQKLELDDIPGLVKFAIKHGLSTLD